MSTSPSTSSSTQPAKYDNNGQYSRASILRYEKIFGGGYISTGGPETTDYLCSRLAGEIRPGSRVLDVGSGIGGAAEHLVREYGVDVTGVDLSPEMISIALERAEVFELSESLHYILGDILELSFPEKFELIWSRDALMHIPDKKTLFAKLYSLTSDDGRLIITDYARRAGPGSPDFEAYVKKTGYHLTDPASYGKLLEGAGYVDVEVEDATDRFMDIMNRECDRLAANRADFLGSFGEQDLNYLIDRWKMKEVFCKAGDMKWGIYKATKRA